DHLERLLHEYISERDTNQTLNHICAFGMASRLRDTVDLLLTRLHHLVCHIVDIERWNLEMVEQLKEASYGERVLFAADYGHVPDEWTVPRCSMVLIGPSLRVTPSRVRQLAGDQELLSAVLFLDEHVCATNDTTIDAVPSPSVPCRRLLETWEYVAAAASRVIGSLGIWTASGIPTLSIDDPIVPANAFDDLNCDRFRRGDDYQSPAECRLDDYVVKHLSVHDLQDATPFYVDIGSQESPFQGSNSFMLEKCLGWRGVCVLSGQSPDPEYRWHVFRAYRSCHVLDHSVVPVSRRVSEDRLIPRQEVDERGPFQLDELLSHAGIGSSHIINVLFVSVEPTQNEVAVIAGIKLADFDIKSIIVKVKADTPVRLTELDYIITSQGYVKIAMLCGSYAVYKLLRETPLVVPAWEQAALPPLHAAMTQRVIDQETSRWFGVEFVE
ncbi:hypothetical protein FOZ63_001734, partial [Perkinsus olseni]